MKIALASSLLLLTATASVAQEWKQIPIPYTNSQGYRIVGFTARATASGCEGSQTFLKKENPKEKDVSKRRWTSASQRDGGTVCTGGTWYYSNGQPGGPEPNLLIKGGKFYRPGSGKR